MDGLGLDSLLGDKDEHSRMQIARRVGAHLCTEDLPGAERSAAEVLARFLVEDAMERVRRELSLAVRSAKTLARDIAMKLAHDVDSVSNPFLEVTEVFTEEEWSQLVLTISRGARIAVARRASMSEGLAMALAEIGDSVVVQTLIENPAAPTTPPVCRPIIDRFEASTWVLDKLAERDDLFSEVAAHLMTRVSQAARTKLARNYKLPEQAEAISDSVHAAAILRLAAELPYSRLVPFAKQLERDGKLGPDLLLAALRHNALAMFEAGLSVLTRIPQDTVHDILRRGSDGHLTGLLSRADFPRRVYSDVWEEIRKRRYAS